MAHRGGHRRNRRRRNKGLKRWQKNALHAVLFLSILFSLWVEGGKTTDWLFLGLAGAVEVS